MHLKWEDIGKTINAASTIGEIFVLPDHNPRAYWLTIVSFPPGLPARFPHPPSALDPCVGASGALPCKALYGKKRHSIFETFTCSTTKKYNTYSDPRIPHDLVDREPLFWFDTEHTLDEIFGCLADIFPFRIGKIVLTGADAGFHSR